MKTITEAIQETLTIARRQRDNSTGRTHQSVRDFNDGRISAYEHCLEVIAEIQTERPSELICKTCKAANPEHWICQCGTKKAKCACKSHDSRQCFLLRHPECRRNTDTEGLYDEMIDEECDCSCHEPTDHDSLDEYVR